MDFAPSGFGLTCGSALNPGRIEAWDQIALSRRLARPSRPHLRHQKNFPKRVKSRELYRRFRLYQPIYLLVRHRSDVEEWSLE